MKLTKKKVYEKLQMVLVEFTDRGCLLIPCEKCELFVNSPIDGEHCLLNAYEKKIKEIKERSN